MGLPLTSLQVSCLLLLSSSLICLVAEATRSSSSNSARALDSLLQDYAFKAFVRPRTGVTYDGVVPPNLTGIEIAATRLRSGSLRFRGYPKFMEFNIPNGFIVQPYEERLALVYHNLGNWSTTYYPLVGYTHLTPVVGLLAYDASNLSAINMPELDIRASAGPMVIEFPHIKSPPDGYVAHCAWFDLYGLVKFSNLSAGNRCSGTEQGHFSIIVDSAAFAPLPGYPNSASGRAPRTPKASSVERKSSRSGEVWVIIVSLLSGFGLLTLLAALVVWTQKHKQRRRLYEMEHAADVGEALNVTHIGSSKAPAAMVTRTQPKLENEYVP